MAAVVTEVRKRKVKRESRAEGRDLAPNKHPSPVMEKILSLAGLIRECELTPGIIDAITY
jgi:hypothetical protein